MQQHGDHVHSVQFAIEHVLKHRRDEMFVANVVFIGPKQGGRNTPPQSGYHPQIKAGDGYTSCVIESLGDESVFDFDKEHIVSLRLMFPAGHEDMFSVGSRVSFFEGSRLIGSGTIVGVL